MLNPWEEGHDPHKLGLLLLLLLSGISRKARQDQEDPLGPRKLPTAAPRGLQGSSRSSSQCGRRKRGRYLVDHEAQLKTKDLAQLSQVGQAAGSEGAVRISDSSQESMDQRVSVLEDQISCKEEEKEGPGDGSSTCSWL